MFGSIDANNKQTILNKHLNCEIYTNNSHCALQEKQDKICKRVYF